MYVCPKCKSDIEESKCKQCAFEIKWNDSIPSFFTGSDVSRRYEEIAAFYDKLYGSMENVWSNLASRGHEFDQFIALLVAAERPKRYLDIGCGEGFLLATVAAPEKFGIDISGMALKSAAQRTSAILCIAFTEELPFQTAYFDVITGIGVMTHFLDDVLATREIHRVLRPGGCYVVGIFIPSSVIESIAVKFSEFVYPAPRPIRFILWVIQKSMQLLGSGRRVTGERKERQPVERYYTGKDVENIFENIGFVISEVITKRKNPDAPLAGHHFRIYRLHKREDDSYPLNT